MSSEQVSEKRINEIINNLAGTGHVLWLAGVDDALRELLQRRKEGGSPEEFVVLMAGRLADIKPEFQAHYLQCLAEIRRATTCLRQYVAGKID